MLNHFQDGGMISALSDAGNRMMKHDDLYQDYYAAYEEWHKDPTNQAKWIYMMTWRTGCKLLQTS